MPNIKAVNSRIIVDSRAKQTLEVDVVLEDDSIGRASVPSGASTGSHEVYKLDDMPRAKANVDILAHAILGKDPVNQKEIDRILLEQDGTEDKSNLGGNVVLAVSLASCDAAAKGLGKDLFAHIHEVSGIAKPMGMPTPLFNIINGGRHADNHLDFQEFMVIPAKDDRPFWDKMLIGVNLYNHLKEYLKSMNYVTSVGDEGGFAPRLESNEEALKILTQIIEQSEYKIGQDVSLGIDVAASSIPNLEQVTYPDEPTVYFKNLVQNYPISILEDPFGEEDWDAWAKLTGEIGDKVKIVGDDLYTTNKKLVEQGIQKKASNAVLIKPNQIGTLTETFETIKLAQQAGMIVIVSHRSGETESTFIADLAVGVGAEFIKTGAPSRSERVAKYNQLIRIAEKLPKA